MSDQANNPYSAPAATLAAAVEQGALASQWSEAQLRATARLHARFHWIGFGIALIGSFFFAMFFVSIVTGMMPMKPGQPPTPEQMQAITAKAMMWFIPGMITLVVAMGLLIASYVFACIQLYRMWTIVQRPGVATTPGQAVGFLFIPFYNFYWVFVAWRGLAKELARHPGGGSAPIGLATAMGILSILVSVPYLGLLAAIPLGIVVPILLTKLTETTITVIRRSPT